MIQVILSSEQYVLHSELATDQDGNGHLLTGSWPAAGAKVGLLELPPRINVTVDRVKQELSISFLNEYEHKMAAARLGRRKHKHHSTNNGWTSVVYYFSKISSGYNETIMATVKGDVEGTTIT